MSRHSAQPGSWPCRPPQLATWAAAAAIALLAAACTSNASTSSRRFKLRYGLLSAAATLAR